MRNDDQPPDPAIEQAKEALIEEIQKLMEGNPICDVTAAIDALIQSSASRLQEVEAERDQWKAFSEVAGAASNTPPQEQP